MVPDRKGSLQHSATSQNVEETPISLETPQTLTQMFQLTRKRRKDLCGEQKHSQSTDPLFGKDACLRIHRKALATEHISLIPRC